MEITPLGTSIERRTAWIQIGPDILWSLIWVQTVQLNSCKLNNQLRSRYINGDNTIGDISRASKGLDPDQADILWSLIWVQTRAVQLNRFLQVKQ